MLSRIKYKINVRKDYGFAHRLCQKIVKIVAEKATDDIKFLDCYY
jgi:hypothetical protein